MAELCSVFVMAESGLAHEPEHNAKEYLAHWLAILRADGKALISPAAAWFVLKAGQSEEKVQVLTV